MTTFNLPEFLYRDGKKILVENGKIGVLSGLQGPQRILGQHVFRGPGGRHFQSGDSINRLFREAFQRSHLWEP